MIIDKCLNSDSVKDIPVPRNMSGAEPTLAEPPVPLALARLQTRPHVRLPKGLRTQHRPSLPLASLKESMDESIVSRRKSEHAHLETDQDNNEIHESGYEIVDIPSPLKKNGSSRRASSSAVSERYTKILDLDTTVPSLYGRNSLPPRRASVAVSVPRADDKGRRRSWAAKLQLERKKRRKSGGEGTDEESEGSTPPSYTRQKRPSWWNVLVPDTILKNRSRRASQQLSRSAESIDQPHRRSKSRSVDHGFTAPFDLETLRSKVEGRFDAVHKDEDEPAKRLPPTPPIKTTTYTVCDRDTLTSVAARFDTTPSELTKLNRLATTFIFPGQSLLVPDKSRDGAKDADGSNDGGDTTSESTQGGPPGEQPEEKDILDTLRPVSPEAPSSPAAPQRFLKINVRHITDGQGVVSGVLLVTPNAVMFDPNVSDTLVMEHGPESYGVIAPMEFVVNAAIYYDIAHMRTHDSDPNAHKGEKPEIYYTNKTHSPGKDSLLVKDETFPELHGAGSAGDGDASGSECSYERGAVLTTEGVERGGDAFPKAFDRELVTPTSTQQTAEERRKSLLDHHWAIPSKERMSIDNASEVSSTTADIKEERGDSLDGSVSSGITQQQPAPELPSLHLVKLSCHDSGIDIRDPILNATPTNTKKVYSDADIVLSHDWVPPVSIAPAEAPLSAPPLGANEDRGSVVGARKPASVSFSLDGSSSANESMSKDDHVGGNKGEKKNKMLKRLSYPLSWMEGLTGDNAASQGSQADSLPTSADSHNSGSVFSKVFNRRSSLGGFGKSEPKKIVGSVPPRLDYRSMVSVDDMPALFVSFDKLIPRPARPSDDPPLYLRLRMGRPIGRTLPRTTPLMSYGRKRMKPEYWFGVPRNRVDDLFKFLNHWVPELYGELGDVTARGYQLIDSDTEWDDDEEGRNKSEKGERSGSQGDVGDLTRESWEVLSMSDELRRALYSSGASVDIEVSPPDLIGSTEILTMEHREKLCGVLPARAQGYMWSLVFSTSQNGFSLGSMYRKMQRVDSPVLLVIQDTDNNVFGALTSSALHPSEHFYGTGESLLFSFTPIQDESAPVTEVGKDEEDSKDSVFFAPGDFEKKPKENDVKTISTLEESQPAPPPAIKSKFQVWQWTGDNMYFIRGSNDNLSIGAGDGKFGLWLDGDLYLGRTQQCTTYGNEPLTTREDFIVKIMECWAFI